MIHFNLCFFKKRLLLPMLLLTVLEANSTTYTLTCTVFLRGAWNGSGMNTSISSILPTNQPYNTSPFNYSGSEANSSIPNTAVDWILVEIRQPVSGIAADAVESTIKVRGVGILLSNGSLKAADATSNFQLSVTLTSGNFFVVIRHRNHLPVMSTALSSATTSHTIDFTNLSNCYKASTVGSDPVVQLPSSSSYGLWAADGNVTTSINAGDDLTISNAISGSVTGYTASDVDMSGSVTSSDLTLFGEQFQYGPESSVPRIRVIKVNWDNYSSTTTYDDTEVGNDFESSVNYWNIGTSSSTHVPTCQAYGYGLKVSLANGAWGPDDGVLGKLFPGTGPGKEWLVKFDLSFDVGFDFSKGGKVGFGIYTGTAADACQPKVDGGSFRLMWENVSSNIKLKPYIYHADQSTTYPTCGVNYSSLFPTSGSISGGTLYKIEMYIKMNSSLSAADGIAILRINGTEVLNNNTVKWVGGSSPADLFLKELRFETFRGGDDYTWAGNSGAIYFDNFEWYLIK